MRTDIPSPCFVMERDKLERNLKRLRYLQQHTGVKILHTIKSFNSIEGLKIIDSYLSGFSVGNQQELAIIDTLKCDHIHSYAPYFYPNDIETIAQHSDTMSLNSLYQWQQYAELVTNISSVGLRINPQLTIKQPKYCNPNYTLRFGIPYRDFLQEIENRPKIFEHLEGLHFHVLCSQGLGGLKYLLSHIDKHYRGILPRLKWLNLGGGHQLTHDDYDRENFISTLDVFMNQYPHISIFFEPGESVVKQSGYLLTTIVDIIPAKVPIVVLDTSTESHLLDLAITKQRLKIRDTSNHTTPYLYQIAGMSCIAGDIIGDYYFHRELHRGENLIFEDMMGYTIVKQTEFNGIKKANFIIDNYTI